MKFRISFYTLLKHILICIFFLNLDFSLGHAESSSKEEILSLKREVKRLKNELKHRPPHPGQYAVPKALIFCGQRIDLTPPSIRKRFESEFLKILKNRYQVQLWINRGFGLFPWIESYAKELGTCKDLKHLALIESALRGEVISRSKARGWWQFMERTGKGLGLYVGPYWDERSDFHRSTYAALKYLKKLHTRFGDWLLAMAAYNTGPGRLSRSLKTQKQDSFWPLNLYQEAERYVPRILAAHYVMTHLSQHHFQRGLDQGWPVDRLTEVQLFLPRSDFLVLQKVKVKKTIKVPISRSKNRKRRRSKSKKRTKKKYKTKVITQIQTQTQINPNLNLDALSLALGISDREFRLQNPALVGSRLPVDQLFSLYIPHHTVHLLKNYLKQSKYFKAIKKAPSDLQETRSKSHHVHQVRPGESVWSIAQKFKISIQRLMSFNHLKADTLLRVGQTLNIPR